MKTIIARFTELKNNVAGTAESEFDDLDYNKVDTALKSVGISIKDADGQFRDLDDVFLELSKRWSGLDRNTQRYIATIAAGSRQQSRFIAMMENYDRTIELVNYAYDSTGKSSQQFAKYQDTIEYKLNKLKTTWEKFRAAFLEGDTFKNAIDGLTALIQKIDDFNLIDIAGLGLVWLTLGKTMIQNLLTGLNQGAKGLSNWFAKNITSTIKKLPGKISALTIDTDRYKQQIHDFEERIKKAERDIEKNSIVIDVDTRQALNKLDDLEATYERYKQEAKDTGSDDSRAERSARERMGKDYRQLEQGRKAKEALAAKDEAEQRRNTAQETLDKTLGKQSELEEQARIRGEAVGQMMGSMITMGITAAITSDNPMDAVKTILVTGVTSIISVIIPMIAEGGAAATATAIASTAGIMAIIMAITAAITGAIVLIKSSFKKAEAKKIDNQVKALEDSISKLDEKISEMKTNLEDLSNEQKGLEDIQKSWKKLENKTVKTAEEQEEYNTLIETVKEQYPELITFYSEENNQIQLSNSLLDQKLEKQKELIAEEQRLLDLQQAEKYNKESELQKQQFAQKVAKGEAIFEQDFLNEHPNAKIKKTSTLTDWMTHATYSKEELDAAINGGFSISGGDSSVGSNIVLDAIKKHYQDDFEEIASEITDSEGEPIDNTTIYSQIEQYALLQNAAERGVISQDDMQTYANNLGLYTDVMNKYGLAIEEYASDLRTAQEAFSADIDYWAQKNAEQIGGILGEGYEGASQVLGQQAAELRKTIEPGSQNENKTRDERRNKMIDELDHLGYDTSGIMTTSFGDFLEDATSGIAGSKWTELSEESKALAKAIGYDEIDTWNKEIHEAEDDAEVREKLRAKYDAYLQSQMNEIIAKNKEKADQIQAELDLFATEKDSLSLNEIEAKAEALADEWNIDQAKAEELLGVDSLRSAAENLQAAFAGTGVEELIDNWNSSLVNVLSSAMENAQLTSSQKELLAKGIDNLMNTYSLSEEAIGVLGNIDLSSSYQEIANNSETYITALKNTGLSLEDATNAFNNYLSTISHIIGRGVLGKEGAQVFLDMNQETIKGFKEQFSSLIEARNESIENNGKISSDTYFKLMEEGFEDYVDITSDGYVILSEKAEEFWTEQAMKPLELLQEQKKINEEEIKMADSLYKKLDNKSVRLSGSQLLKNLGYSDSAITASNGTVTMSFKTLIKKYKELKEAGEDTSAVLALFGDNAAMVEKMVQAGYDDIEKYIKALKEGNVALESAKADTWIQGLESLSESMSDAQDKVQDLKDELEDLNEQLAENQEAVDEANKALEEAKFGTEDYQSGVDGLINYNNEIERLNKNLERTTDLMSDVSSVEEASKLISSYREDSEAKLANLGAEKQVIDKALDNLKSTLMTNFSDYTSFDENGKMAFDYSIEDARIPDKMKDNYKELIEQYNEFVDKKEKISDEERAVNKAIEDMQKDLLDKRVAMEEKVLEVIKSKMQEEIDAVTEKYEAMEEADTNYVDALEEAINKQRELRDKENEYEDLATKQKKLSLIQRDTSGANRKDALTLEKEVEKDRQNLLDKEVDDLIESMKELYEKQAEAHELEIEVAQSTMEDIQLLNQMVQDIISSQEFINNPAGWFAENDSSVEDMTVAQSEKYFNEIKELSSGFLLSIAEETNSLSLNAEEVMAQQQIIFEQTGENVSTIGTTLHDLAVAEAQNIIDEAAKARDEAVERMQETQDKIAEVSADLRAAEENAVSLHSAAMEEMVKASQSSISKVATFAAKWMIESSGLDLDSPESVQKFANEHNFVNKKTGEFSQGFVNALADKGYDTSNMTVDRSWSIWVIPKTSGAPSTQVSVGYDTKAEAEAALQQAQKSGKWIDNSTATFRVGMGSSGAKVGAYKYATGGLVNYTGPAWVDGTPNKPEAFLSAEDTARIGAAAKLLANIPIFNTTSNAQNAVSSNIGDTSIEIHINVENISSDYDVDQMIERVKNDIVDVSKPVGSSVILRK